MARLNDDNFEEEPVNDEELEYPVEQGDEEGYSQDDLGSYDE